MILSIINVKKIFYITSYLLIPITTANAQQPELINFFPHNVGDLWQYVTSTQSGSEFWEKKITAIDTVWADSSIIITINYRNEFDFLHKIYFNDSLKIYWKTFGDWGIRYKFNVPLNSFWLSDPYYPYYTKYVDEYVAEIFGNSLLVREYWIGDSLFQLPLWTEHLALGIGEFYREFEIGITILTGCIINGIQYGTIVNVEIENETSLPHNLQLSNYPNPFNSTTIIEYAIKQDGLVSLKVYDVLGSEVVSLVNEYQFAGKHSVQFNAFDLPSGMYIYRLTSRQFTSSKKLILLK